MEEIAVPPDGLDELGEQSFRAVGKLGTRNGFEPDLLIMSTSNPTIPRC